MKMMTKERTAIIGIAALFCSQRMLETINLPLYGYNYNPFTKIQLSIISHIRMRQQT
jgi:hypothetical protein